MEKCPPLEEIHVYNLVLKPILVCSSATVDHLPRSLTLSLAPSSVTLTICMSSVTASMNILCALPPFQPGSSIFSILCPLLRLSVCTNLISLTSLKTWAFPLIHSLLILSPPGHPNKSSVYSVNSATSSSTACLFVISFHCYCYLPVTNLLTPPSLHSLLLLSCALCCFGWFKLLYVQNSLHLHRFTCLPFIKNSMTCCWLILLTACAPPLLIEALVLLILYI